MSYFLNLVCIKLISNKQGFRKIEVQIFKVVLFLLTTEQPATRSYISTPASARATDAQVMDAARAEIYMNSC